MVVGLLAKAVGQLTVDATQLGQQIADGIGVALGVGAFGGACSRAADQVMAVDGAHAGVTEGMEGFQVLVGGGLVTTQAHFTEVAQQADGGAAIELEAGSRAVIHAQAALQPEIGLQAAAQIFHAAKAQTAAGVAAVGQAGNAFAGRGDVGHRHVGHAKDGHAGLSQGTGGNGQGGKGEKSSFHAVHLFVEMRKPMQYGDGLPWTGPVWD